MGIDYSYICQIASGKKRIGELMFMRFCNALNLDVGEMREKFADQIAPRGNKYLHRDQTQGAVTTKTRKERQANTTRVKRERQANGIRLTIREENDPAELLINFMELFSCKLNDDGRRVTMAFMKMLAGIEAFNNQSKQEEKHESTEDEIQD